METLSPERKEQIIANYLMAQKAKSRYKPTAIQRKVWNKAYYDKRKERPEYKQQARTKYMENSAVKKDKAKYHYYRRINQLDKLKSRYPEIYLTYVIE